MWLDSQSLRIYSTNLGSPFPGCLIPGNRLSLNFSCYLLVRTRGEANISTACPVWGNKLLREHGLQQQQPLNTALVFLLKKISWMDHRDGSGWDLFQRTEADPQHTHDGSQLPLTLVPEVVTPSFCEPRTHMACKNMHVGKHPHIHTIK